MGDVLKMLRSVPQESVNIVIGYALVAIVRRLENEGVCSGSEIARTLTRLASGEEVRPAERVAAECLALAFRTQPHSTS